MVDYCIYVGNSNKSYFLTHGVKPDQLIFGPHAIDNCRFEHALNNSRNIRKQFEIKDHEILMLFAGKFIPKKNPIQLLDFFLKFQPKNAHLLFVGNGILEEKLKEKSLNNNRIHFLEFQNQSTMPSIYKEADVFILPSTGPGETWGLAINEAMVCGLPVLVSSKCGCSYDLVQDGENGFVFNQQNMELIIEKFLVKSRDEMKKMGEINPEIIKNYTYTKTIENLNKLINK
jgi:glycosyltransferase involved in cell wall biosynthesis